MRTTWLAGLAGVGLVLLCGCSTTPLVPPPAAPLPVPPSSAAVGSTTIVAVAAPAAPAASFPTLPEFLGIPQTIHGVAGFFHTICTRITSRLGGRFPGLEPKPPLLPISDPANLGPDAAPSVQAAAKIKQQEDAAAQKVKAVAYLATVGCGCYEGVAEALAENLKDCNEEVRHATVKALREIASQPCCSCGGNSCCTPEIHKSLTRLAWETDDTGCFVEPSQRVRRLARLALQNCCAPIVSPEDLEPQVPQEGPQLEEGELLSRRQPAEAVAPVLAAAPSTAAPSTAAHSPKSPTPESPAPKSPTPESPALALQGQVLAEVNGEPIDAAMVLAEVRRRTHESPGRSVGDLSRDPLFHQVLEEAIDRKVLSHAARSVLSATVLEQIAQAVNGRSHQLVQQVGYDRPAASPRLENAWAEELLRRQLDYSTEVTASQIRAVYDRSPERFREADRFRWQHFWVDFREVPDPAQAKAFIEYVRLGVTGFRTDPPPGFDNRRVYVEQFDWTTLEKVAPPTLQQRLRDLRPGQASPIAASSATISFVLVNEVAFGERRPLESVAGEIRDELIAQRRSEARSAYVAQLRSRAEIRTAGASVDWAPQKFPTSQASRDPDRGP